MKAKKVDLHTQQTAQDMHFMRAALLQAKLAAKKGEVPVGAVLVVDGRIISAGHNQPISTCDPTAHAEIVALRQACADIGNYRLPKNSTLYVTLEPCTMCVGALIHARLTRLVYAATEPRAGAVVSTASLADMQHYNHRIDFVGGVLAEHSSELLKRFFRERR